MIIKPSRREVLQTMAAASIFPAMSPLADRSLFADPREPADQCATNPYYVQQCLAVVFHGFFAFLFGLQQIEIWVPAMTNHVYWAGNLGQEDENVLQPGSVYSLFGVESSTGWTPPMTGGKPDLSMLTFPFVAARAMDKGVFCKLTIPWPDDIFVDRLFQGTTLTESGGYLKGNPTPSAVYAFIYKDSSILERPVLSGTNWRGCRSMGGPNGSGQINLHVRAEEANSGLTGDGVRILNDIFGTNLVLNPGSTCVPNPAAGCSNIITKVEENSLLEEKQIAACSPGGNGARVKAPAVDSPSNCASIGGCPPAGAPSRLC